jgi:hypothetical protein
MGRENLTVGRIPLLAAGIAGHGLDEIHETVYRRPH